MFRKKEVDVQVHCVGTEIVYARGILKHTHDAVHIIRNDGACTTVLNSSIRYIKSYPVKEVTE